jgi:hypothetical protein
MSAAETVNVSRACPACGRLVVWAGTRRHGEGDGTSYSGTEHDNCAATGETE